VVVMVAVTVVGVGGGRGSWNSSG